MESAACGVYEYIVQRAPSIRDLRRISCEGAQALYIQRSTSFQSVVCCGGVV